MDIYPADFLEPALNETERLMYGLVNRVSEAMSRHRFHDSTAPPPPDLSAIKNVWEYKAAARAWQSALRQHHEEHGYPPYKSHAPLEELWPMIDPPGSLEVLKSIGNDLVFRDFALCQRYVDEKRSPAGWLPRWYVVGVPNGKEPLRCIVKEITGRKFCTVAAHTCCSLPADDDFRVLRVSGNGVNYETRDRGAVVMRIYVPGRYGDWLMIRDKISRMDDGEMVLGFDEDIAR